MSARVERALDRLAAQHCILAPERSGRGLGVFPNGDRRRRPLVRLTAAEVRALESSGAIVDAGDGAFVLSAAGRALVRRTSAAPSEAYAAQHRPVVDRVVADGEGLLRAARGHDADGAMRRLAALRDGAGKPWLNSNELAAAVRLRADWEAGEQGLVRGSDWGAPPKGAARRGAGGDAALAAHCDARRRAAEALERLAPALRRVVERVCLREEGLEMLERAEAWPARSGKLALKLALAQLAAG
jgi:hypothetical protein